MMQQFLQRVLIMAIGVFLGQPADAFMNGCALFPCHHQKLSTSSSALGSGDIFDGFRRLFQGDNEEDSGIDSADEDLPAGTSILASIPVKSIKPGGLRLFLMFYCMGMQNTPDRLTWRADQPSSEEYVVEMLFHDATGILSIELVEDEIKILRNGSCPSTAYIMQESVILAGIINELRTCAFDESIPVDDRLLVPESADSLDIIGEELAFG